MFAFMSLLFVSCDDMNSIHEQWLGTDPAYIGTPSQLQAQSGRGRVKLTWTQSADTRIAQTMITWTDGITSGEMLVDFERTVPGVQQVEQIVDGLAEATYTFKLWNLDAEGAHSVPQEVEARSYGEEYEGSLRTRTFTSVDYGETDDELLVQWSPWPQKDCVKTIMSYTNMYGEKVTYDIENDALETKISPKDLIAGTEITTQSVYLLKNTIDELYSPEIIMVAEFRERVKGVIPNGTYVAIKASRTNYSAAEAVQSGVLIKPPYEKEIWQADVSDAYRFRMNMHGNQANNPDMAEGNSTGSWLEFTLDPTTMKITNIEGAYYKSAGAQPYGTYKPSKFAADAGGYDAATGYLTVNLMVELEAGGYREYTEVLHLNEGTASPYLPISGVWNIITGRRVDYKATSTTDPTPIIPDPDENKNLNNYGEANGKSSTKSLSQPYAFDGTLFKMDKFGPFTGTSDPIFLRVDPATNKVIELWGWTNNGSSEICAHPTIPELGTYDPATKTLKLNYARRTFNKANDPSQTKAGTTYAWVFITEELQAQ